MHKKFSTLQSWDENRPSWYLVALCLFLLMCVGGCDAQETSQHIEVPDSQRRVDFVDSTISQPQATNPLDLPRIVAFGDSLTAGLGVSPDQSYPAQLQERLKQGGYNYEVVNAGVSGDTTAGGLRRLNWVLKSRPSIVILELGANDAMRGQPLEGMYSNLDKMITQFQEAGALVVLAGMKIPPNYGLDYTNGFSSMFEQLAREHDITLIPFFLEGVAAKTELNQADGIHPTAQGYQIVTEMVMKAITPLLEGGRS